MMLNKYLNKIICGDSYKLIKELPDKSVDCIYTDIPYCGSIDLGERLGKRKMELMGCTKIYEENKNTKRSEVLRIAKNKKKQNIDIISIEDGIGFEIEPKWCDIANNRLNKTDANGQISIFYR